MWSVSLLHDVTIVALLFSSTAATCAFMSFWVVNGPKDAAEHFSLPSFVRMEILPAWGFKYLQRKMVRNFAVTES